MNVSSLKSLILEQLGHEPTAGQYSAAELLAQFIYAAPAAYPQLLFVLKGFAGTGKTSLVSALVKALPATGIKTVLLAPTGRAAKVLSAYANQLAYTIHRKIYVHRVIAGGGVRIALRKNLHRSTLFIVDEASMICNYAKDDLGYGFESRDLLSDLFEYVYSSNCRMLLVGDTAQLPPVGMNESPALDIDFLRASYSVVIFSCQLQEVVRQQQRSGILYHATLLRQRLEDALYAPPYFEPGRFTDVKRVGGQEFEELMLAAADKAGTDSLVVITRSNRRANLFNKAIRQRILFRDQEINAGDILMIVRNNYFWLNSTSEPSFLANGDIIEVQKIISHEAMYGFRYIQAIVRLVDYPGEAPFEAKLMIDTLDSETPALSEASSRQLIDNAMEDYTHLTSLRKKRDAVRENPWVQALQVKFAYALTCHKTQGGQWENVFVDQGFVTDDMLNREYLRWLYTAITRATRNLFLVNFEDRFFG